MQPTRILFLLAAVLLTQSVVAQGLPGVFQAQLDALEARIQVLEDSAPSSSVEGRTYCFVLNRDVMRGQASTSTEVLISRVIRRTFTFNDDGTYDSLLVSDVRNTQADDGIVTLAAPGNIDLSGTYMQTGNKLDMVFPFASFTANWYVSKDGSVIYGTRISHGLPRLPPVVTVGITRNWTLVETDPLDVCDAENQ